MDSHVKTQGCSSRRFDWWHSRNWDVGWGIWLNQKYLWNNIQIKLHTLVRSDSSKFVCVFIEQVLSSTFKFACTSWSGYISTVCKQHIGLNNSIHILRLFRKRLQYSILDGIHTVIHQACVDAFYPSTWPIFVHCTESIHGFYPKNIHAHAQCVAPMSSVAIITLRIPYVSPGLPLCVSVGMLLVTGLPYTHATRYGLESASRSIIVTQTEYMTTTQVDDICSNTTKHFNGTKTTIFLL